MVNIELTNDEAQTLMNILDLAVKAGGLQVAQAALPLAVKIQETLTKDINNT